MLETKVTYSSKGLDIVRENIRFRVKRALKENAEDILQMAKALCPVKTGALRASLHVEQLGEFEYAVRDGVPYGILVEKGYRDPQTGQFIEPRPFLQPAVDRTRARANERIKEAWKVTVEEASAQTPTKEQILAQFRARLGKIA